MAPLPSATGGGQGGTGSTGLSTRPVGQRHPCSYLSRTFCTRKHTSALCRATTSGPFRIVVAPLSSANGMAGLLVLQRGVMWRAEQRAEDGSLIDCGVGGLELGGWLPDHWPMLPFLSVSHPTAQPHPPLLYFSSFFLLCLSFYLVSTVFLSPQPFTSLPPQCCWKIQSLQGFNYVVPVCLYCQCFEECLCPPWFLRTFFISEVVKMLSCF